MDSTPAAGRDAIIAGSAGNAGSAVGTVGAAKPGLPAESLFLISAVAQYTGATIAVRLFDEARPATIAWFRVIGAAVALLIAARVFRQRSERPWNRREVASAAILGVTTACMNLLFFLAIERLPLGKGVTIEFIGPITVAAFRTRSRRNAFALVLAASGVALLSGLEIDGDLVGIGFILGASAMWAAYIVIGSRVAKLERGVEGLGLGLVFGAFAIAPFGIGGAGTVVQSPRLLLLCLLVGVFSNAIGYGIDQYVMRRMSMRRFSLMLALLPVVALIMGAVFLDQQPELFDFVGVGLVLAGVVAQERNDV
jgi:inner membrane transporter RhtA